MAAAFEPVILLIQWRCGLQRKLLLVPCYEKCVRVPGFKDTLIHVVRWALPDEDRRFRRR